MCWCADTAGRDQQQLSVSVPGLAGDAAEAQMIPTCGVETQDWWQMTGGRMMSQPQERLECEGWNQQTFSTRYYLQLSTYDKSTEVPINSDSTFWCVFQGSRTSLEPCECIPVMAVSPRLRGCSVHQESGLEVSQEHS